MALFQRPDGEGQIVEARPRRARREKVPKRQMRMRTQLEWHKMRHKEGFTVAEIAGIFGRSEPTINTLAQAVRSLGVQPGGPTDTIRGAGARTDDHRCA